LVVKIFNLRKYT